MNEATKIFFGKLYLGQANSDDYVNWAISCLEDGFDSKNLRMLAATEKFDYPSETQNRLKCSLEELGWDYPSKEENLLSYAKVIAQKIVAKDINPLIGCGQIYEIARELEYAPELIEWVYLDDGLDPNTYETIGDIDNYPAIETPKWIEAIIKQANKLAKSNY